MRFVTPLAPALILLALPTLGGVAHAEKKATILSTASVRGETISCGCKKKDLGGLPRRATLIAQKRSDSPDALLVDAGDFGTDMNPGVWSRTEFQWEMMAKLKYDAVTPGTNEMLDGLPQLQTLLAKAPDIKVVSANVTDKAGTLLWAPFQVIEKGGVRFGVTGVTDGSFYSFNLNRGVQKADDFAFRDMKESLLQVVPALRKQCDVVVLLLHSGAPEVKGIVESVPGIDVVVVGRNPGYIFGPEKTANSYVIRAGRQGQYLGTLDLTLDDTGKIAAVQGENLPVGEALVEDAGIKATVLAFNKKVEPLEKAETPKVK